LINPKTQSDFMNSQSKQICKNDLTLNKFFMECKTTVELIN